MTISGMASYFNAGNMNVFHTAHYNTAPVQKVSNVSSNNYNVTQTVKNELSRYMFSDASKFPSNTTASVVLNNGTIFVGTIIDFLA